MGNKVRQKSSYVRSRPVFLRVMTRGDELRWSSSTSCQRFQINVRLSIIYSTRIQASSIAIQPISKRTPTAGWHKPRRIGAGKHRVPLYFTVANYSRDGYCESYYLSRIIADSLVTRIWFAMDTHSACVYEQERTMSMAQRKKEAQQKAAQASTKSAIFLKTWTRSGLCLATAAWTGKTHLLGTVNPPIRSHSILIKILTAVCALFSLKQSHSLKPSLPLSAISHADEASPAAPLISVHKVCVRTSAPSTTTIYPTCAPIANGARNDAHVPAKTAIPHLWAKSLGRKDPGCRSLEVSHHLLELFTEATELQFRVDKVGQLMQADEQ